MVQFAIMGSAYMQNVMQVEKPRVALLNVGAEETKGRELELESYVQLSQAPVNFIGNIEARELPAGAADVVVTDGFTGNVALKLYEGMGKFMAHQMKGNLFAGAAGKLAALLILPKIKALTKKMDYKAVGGAVMLGVQKPVIKAHGSSDGTAFFQRHPPGERLRCRKCGTDHCRKYRKTGKEIEGKQSWNIQSM